MPLLMMHSFYLVRVLCGEKKGRNRPTLLRTARVESWNAALAAQALAKCQELSVLQLKLADVCVCNAQSAKIKGLTFAANAATPGLCATLPREIIRLSLCCELSFLSFPSALRAGFAKAASL